MKTKVRNYIHSVKEKLEIGAINATKLQKVLADDTGASAVEIGIAAVIAVVLALIVLNAFTGIFSNTIIPGIQEKIKSIFSVS